MYNPVGCTSSTHCTSCFNMKFSSTDFRVLLFWWKWDKIQVWTSHETRYERPRWQILMSDKSSGVTGALVLRFLAVLWSEPAPSSCHNPALPTPRERSFWSSQGPDGCFFGGGRYPSRSTRTCTFRWGLRATYTMWSVWRIGGLDHPYHPVRMSDGVLPGPGQCLMFSVVYLLFNMNR
jgi:hypothetical protein